MCTDGEANKEIVDGATKAGNGEPVAQSIGFGENQGFVATIQGAEIVVHSLLKSLTGNRQLLSVELVNEEVDCMTYQYPHVLQQAMSLTFVYFDIAKAHSSLICFLLKIVQWFAEVLRMERKQSFVDVVLDLT